MKSNIKVFLLIFSMLGLFACNKSEDLVSDGAKEGGLVSATGSIPYKLGATPKVDINLSIPLGPGVVSIKVYNKYFAESIGKASEKVLMTTVSIGSANVSAATEKKLSIVYTDLIKDILVDGVALPTDETLLPIGDYWELNYVSVLEDGREVVNNAKTTIAVANIYAGYYQCVGTFVHPTLGPRDINEEKFLTPLSAYSCRVNAGDLGYAGYTVVVTVDPATNLVSFSGGTGADMFAITDSTSRYDPATGMFHLFYYYVGSTGQRRMYEHYTPKL